MIEFIFLFSIIFILIKGLDRYFYCTISKILSFKGLSPIKVLDSLGYYNKSIFTSNFYPFIISLVIGLVLYSFYYYLKVKKEKEVKLKILDLEEDLVKINKGDYTIDISKKDDDFSILRDEIYKIIVSLKSLEEEANRQKFSLKRDLSNIAHQLKTPITSIGFMAELIREDEENTQIYLEKLYSELEKLNKFTEVLLKLSKVNSNTIEYKYIDLSISEIIEDIVNSLNRHRKVKIEYIGEDFTIQADEVWLYEAFLNIIKNSIEHTKDKVIIRLESNPIYRLVEISDNGRGVSEEALDRIFDRFYRGDTSLPGYGIGLNLAKAIIENHSGDIRAYNRGGLTFEIKFYNV